MLPQKEFYFVRHGQTDHNIAEDWHKLDCHEDIPLNATGREQAEAIAPVIAALPIRSVCSSPLKRAQETSAIITSQLEANHHPVHDLGECSTRIWFEMAGRGMDAAPPEDAIVRPFMDRVLKGLNHALLLPGPSLIVAHGGVHWAICCWLGIKEHEWSIGNCVPVHFTTGEKGRWTARKLV